MRGVLFIRYLQVEVERVLPGARGGGGGGWGAGGDMSFICKNKDHFVPVIFLLSRGNNMRLRRVNASMAVNYDDCIGRKATTFRQSWV